MQVLILSCNTGGGHNAAGSAILERLRERGHGGERVDFLGLAGEKVSAALSGLYVETVKNAPALFGVIYGVGRAVSSAEHALGWRSPVYLTCAQVIPALEEYLRANPCDAVIAPHMFPAMALTEMRRRNLPLPLTVAVSTDYTCIPFFEEEDCDWTLVPDGLCQEEFARRGFQREKLIPLGIPVSGQFYRRVGREKAVQLLGLDPDMRWILIMGGSMGAGRLPALARYLLRLTGENVGLAVVCGNNQRLRRQLSRQYGKNPRVRVIGHTDQVSLYMEASQLLYTKPGGVTSTEGAVMGIPMVHMNPIPGCETRNREYFTRSGMSVSGRVVLAQAVKGARLLEDPERRARMVAAQRRQIATDAAARLVDLLERQTGGGDV